MSNESILLLLLSSGVSRCSDAVDLVTSDSLISLLLIFTVILE